MLFGEETTYNNRKTVARGRQYPSIRPILLDTAFAGGLAPADGTFKVRRLRAGSHGT